MKRSKLIIPLTAALIGQVTIAAETDHYSNRNTEIIDISEKLNSYANKYLAKAIEETNKSIRCDESTEKVLYANLKKYFANHSKGQLSKDLIYGNDFARINIPLTKSVYANWGVLNGFLLGRRSAAKSPLALAPMIKVGEQVIGTDKIEHMFGMGYRYFKKHHLKDKKLIKTLKYGVFNEKTILGGNRLATGVFSYADLSANFNGMRMWNHILQLRDDVLGPSQNIGPYAICENGKYQVVKSNPIDFKKYVDASFDESINCSKFATRKGLRNFKSRMKGFNKEYTCPMDQEVLRAMQAKYRIKFNSKGATIDHWIINEDGNEKVSYLNEF